MILVINGFYAHCAVFYPSVAIFFINKKVAQRALLYTENKFSCNNKEPLHSGSTQ
jgi:hypothetical protein